MKISDIQVCGNELMGELYMETNLMLCYIYKIINENENNNIKSSTLMFQNFHFVL